MEDITNVGKPSYTRNVQLFSSEVQNSETQYMESKTSLADMVAPYRGIHITHLVLDTGYTQTFTRDVSVPTTGRTISGRIRCLDSRTDRIDSGF